MLPSVHTPLKSKLNIQLEVSPPANPLADLFTKRRTSLGTTENSPRAHFYSTFRNRSRLTETTRLKKQHTTPALAMLNHCHSQKLHPLPLGLPEKKKKSVNLSYYSLSDRYAQALSAGLQEVSSLKQLVLNDNHLSPLASESILSSVSSHPLKTLSLAYNRVDVRGIECLIALTDSLKVLNLESTNLQTPAVKLLCQGLKETPRLETLNLAKNNLGRLSGQLLGNFLEENTSLKALDLHWNNFSQEAARYLFDGLAKNATLLQLDLSWNGLSTNASEMLGSFTNFLQTNTTLRHLDLSYNSLKYEDCLLLADAIKMNHTIFGIHMIGNACSVDSRGFLHPTMSIAPSINPLARRRLFQQPKLGENCWVCEKWVETRFRYTDNSQQVFIHLEDEQFRPVPMIRAKKVQKYTCVLPERETKVFFTTGDGQVLDWSEGMLIPGARLEVAVNYTEDSEVALTVTQVYSYRPVGNACDTEYPFLSKPRMPYFTVTEEEAPECEASIWDLARSVFKDYVFDTPKLFEQCFDFDWHHSKIPALFSKDHQDLSKTKRLLKTHYRKIVKAYKVLAVTNFSEIFSVSSNVLFDLLGQCNILESRYSASDFGVNWNAALLPKIKGQVYNPGNALVRYELMEMFVRIAVDKYVRPGKTSKISEALALLLSELSPALEALDSTEWRNEYLCEEVDQFFQNHQQLFKAIFARYSGKKTLPGCKPFMCIEEFREFCMNLGCYEVSTARSIDKAFASAMMTQEDELYRKRHMEMSEVEFYEAFARVTECLGYPGTVPLENRLELSYPLLLRVLGSQRKS